MTKKKCSGSCDGSCPTEAPKLAVSNVVLKKKKDDISGTSAEIWVDGVKLAGAIAFSYELGGQLAVMTIKILGRFSTEEK